MRFKYSLIRLVCAGAAFVSLPAFAEIQEYTAAMYNPAPSTAATMPQQMLPQSNQTQPILMQSNTQQSVNVAAIPESAQTTPTLQAPAPHIDPAALVAAMQRVGVSHEQIGNHVNVVADELAVLSAIPELQRLGVVNTNISHNDINSHPVTLSGAIAMMYASSILPVLYQNNSVDDLHVTVYLHGADEYGKEIKMAMMSFDFDRKLNEKINWNSFQAQNILKVASNFKLEKWYEERLAAE